MLSIASVSKRYRHGGAETVALDRVSLEIPAGEFCAIMGPSGAGKSTLMNIIGLLDRPSDGTLSIAGRTIVYGSADELAGLRNRHIGFVFQSFHLIPTLNVMENVRLPLLYAGKTFWQSDETARRKLALVGLSGLEDRRPAQLSGGQRQRVAIARALVAEPAILLADEPTGALDAETSASVLNLVVHLNRTIGLTVVMITHDASVAGRAARIVTIASGTIASDVKTGQPCGG